MVSFWSGLLAHIAHLPADYVKVGYINKTGYKINKVKVRVLIIVYKVGFSVILVLVLVLAKLFLKK